MILCISILHGATVAPDGDQCYIQLSNHYGSWLKADAAVVPCQTGPRPVLALMEECALKAQGTTTLLPIENELF